MTHPSRSRSQPLVAALSLLFLFISPDSGSARESALAPLTARDTLARIYDRILDAQFDDAGVELAACRDAPAAACLVLDATRLWWRIQIDPHNLAHDREFSRRVDIAITAAEAWTKREPHLAEAWFYLGGAYGARVQWRVLRTERLAAARDGKRIKDSLDEALRRDPALEDANFGIGLYQYYADIAPTVAKILRWLLLLPGGNKVEGLARMQRAREYGQLVRGEADFQLHLIYLWYEKQFDKALALVTDLAARYPRNPFFLQTLAEIHSVYFHDPTSSAKAYEHLLALAVQGRVNERVLAEMQARLGLARELEALFESDRALEQARTIIAARPLTPYGASAEAWFLAGRALQHLGQSTEAQQALAQAMSAIPTGDPLALGARIRLAQAARIDSISADAYRLSLAGWRAFERKAYGEAEASLMKATTLRPTDTVIRYRYGRVLQARGRNNEARAQWEVVATAGATTPAPIYAEACVALGTILETSQDRARALTLYERAQHTFGASAETRATAGRHLERLRQGMKR